MLQPASSTGRSANTSKERQNHLTTQRSRNWRWSEISTGIAKDGTKVLATLTQQEQSPNRLTMSPANVLQLLVQRNRILIAHVATRLQQCRLIPRQLPAVIDENTNIFMATLRLPVKPHSPELLWILEPTVRHQLIVQRT